MELISSPRTVGELLATKKNPVIFSIDSGASVLKAAQALARHNVGALVVLERQSGAGEVMPIGIISERDIIRNSRFGFSHLEKLPVSDVMTRDVVIAVPEDSLSYVMGIMTQCRIRHLPVMHGKRLIGILSIGDVVNAQISESSFENRILREYIEGKYPA